MYIQLVQVQLRPGIDERTLLQASERFQEAFVSKQRGILKRVLMRGKHGGFADLVFFASKEDADRVAEAEATNEHCAELFKLMLPPDPNLPDMGVLSFDELKTYE
jgi:hypothetical protein